MKFAIPVDDTTSAKITGRRGGKRTAMEAAAREALASGEHAHIVSSAENRCLNGICPRACKSDIQSALDTLDDLLTAEGGLDALGVEDIDAVDDWASNVQLDIMRYRRLREGIWTVWRGGGDGPGNPPPAPSPVSPARREARE